MKDPFATMLAVIFVAINNYTGFASIVVNGVHVVFIVSIKAW